VATVEDALMETLAGAASLAAYTGARVYPEQAPQTATLPYITVTRVSAVHDHNLSASSGLVEVRDQIDIIAADKRTADLVAELVRLELDGLVGTVTAGGEDVVIQHCYLDTDNATFIEPTDGSDTGIRRASQDYAVWAEETIPS
jgi:hypothetical protein